MRSEQQNPGEVYAARAMESAEPPVSPISIPKIREARDLVYNGTSDPGSNGSAPAGTLQTRHNKKQKQRRISPFTIVLLLLGGAVSSVLYIGNILAVGHLMVQVNQLQLKHQQIVDQQEQLKAHINRLAGLERIQQLAQDQLGLRNPKQIPQWMEIDPERINEVNEIFQQKMEQRR